MGRTITASCGKNSPGNRAAVGAAIAVIAFATAPRIKRCEEPFNWHDWYAKARTRHKINSEVDDAFCKRFQTKKCNVSIQKITEQSAIGKVNPIKLDNINY